MEKGKSILILFSGGYDSTLLVLMAIKMGYKVQCILFDYGQTHIKELEIAIRFCKEHKISYSCIILNFEVESKLTSGQTRYEDVSEWHVPSRNLIFLSHVASIAEQEGINLIWYGANYGDREALFPDCYQEWVFQLNELLAINGSIKITVEAPLLGMTKETIITFGESNFKLKKEQTFSGYGEVKYEKN